MRAYWERRAYAVSLRWMKNNTNDQALLDLYKAKISYQFTSSAYLWMWPNKTAVDAWIEEVLK